MEILKHSLPTRRAQHETKYDKKRLKDGFYSHALALWNHAGLQSAH